MFRRSAARVLGPLVAVAGCSGATTPPPGQLMLVLESNGGLGTSLGFSRVDVVVTDARAGGQIARNYALSPARLPGTVALVSAVPSSAPTKVEVFATDEKGALRIYQAMQVTLPSEGARMLRVKLDTACDGIFPKLACPGGTASCTVSPTQACLDEHTCLAGRCVPAPTIDAKELPNYEPARIASCAAESDGTLCTRRGIACGSFVLADDCGTPRIVRCGACPGEETARTAALLGPGLDDCGPLGADACARSMTVPGGTFFAGESRSFPATVSDFRLDRYEVTVGRFRKFVDAWVGGWRPAPGSGKHLHLNGGAGLATTRASSFEAGWDAEWSTYVGAPHAEATTPSAPGATTRAAWDENLACDRAYATWTTASAASDVRPQNCMSWYDLHAFCIWDGGFVPSGTEWEYAAAGGAEERLYPWGSNAPAPNANLAVHGCYWNGAGRGGCSGRGNIAPVGSVAAGAGRWGQLDLAGSLWEWGLDWELAGYPSPCVDCVELTPAVDRVVRGGSFYDDPEDLPVAARGRLYGFPAGRDRLKGGRCARMP